MISSYRADHLEAIYAGGLNHEPGEDTIAFGKHAAALQIEGMSYTYLVDGVPILCAGVAPLWPGVGEGWAVASQHIYRHGVSAARAARRGFSGVIERSQLHRVQTAVLVGAPRLSRFAQFLGFEREGLMRAYGSDRKDYDLYSRVM